MGHKYIEIMAAMDAIESAVELYPSEWSEIKAELEKRANFDMQNVINQLNRNCHNYYPSIDCYCISQKAVKLDDALKIVKCGGMDG